MEKIKGWEEVKASGDFERLPNGAYLCTIINAEDVAEKQYLKIEYDICDGKFVGFASEAYKNLQFWILSTIRSYKDSALGMFKSFTNAIEKSNEDFKWDWDETKLEGQDIGFVIVTEHYLKDSGDEGLRYKVKSTFAAPDYEKYASKTYEDMYTDDLTKPTQAAKSEASNPFAK